MRKFAPSLFALIAASLLAFTNTPDISAQSRTVSDADIESVVKNYLQEHPEVVVEAIQEWQRRQKLAQMLPTIETYRGYLENDPDYPVLGNPNGDVTVVEFFDYRCGYCRRHFPTLMKLVEEDGNIRLIPRQFPVLDRPDQAPVSRLASRAAIASHKQGKFKDFHVAMMSAPGGMTEDGIYAVAAEVGLNLEQLKLDMRDKLVEKNIENTLAIGRDIGFTGTPSYIIGSGVVLGAEGYDSLKHAVARARSEKASGR